MSTLAKDARYFVDGVTKYLRQDVSPNQSLLPKVTAALHKITASARKEKVALVEAAVPLTTKEKGDIGRVLSRLLTHAVTMECKVNKDLLGGIRIIVGDWIVDTSLTAQIHAIQERLMQ